MVLLGAAFWLSWPLAAQVNTGLANSTCDAALAADCDAARHHRQCKSRSHPRGYGEVNIVAHPEHWVLCCLRLGAVINNVLSDLFPIVEY
jgi:hypothetical protein